MKTFKTIGILGGMGPSATIKLYENITNMNKVLKDQDHIPIIINSCPQIPDRTEALLYGGKSPLPTMIREIKKLDKIGVDFILIPYNTAHAYYKQLQKNTGTTIINMISETVKDIPTHIKKVGLLATSGTVKTKVYQDELENKGLEVILPNADSQENEVMKSIYGEKGIKAGYINKMNKDLLKSASKKLIEKGAQGIILGCTEISLLLSQKDFLIDIFDPLKIIARNSIIIATSNF